MTRLFAAGVLNSGSISRARITPALAVPVSMPYSAESLMPYSEQPLQINYLQVSGNRPTHISTSGR